MGVKVAVYMRINKFAGLINRILNHFLKFTS